MKKILQAVLSLLCIACLFLLSGCSESNVAKVEEEPILLSMPEEEGIFIDEIGENSLLLVRLNTDYGFEDNLNKGASSLEDQLKYFDESGIVYHQNLMKLSAPNCTTFTAKNGSGEYIYGRNNDWVAEDTIIVLYTKPRNGYASVSITDGVYFGYENENVGSDEIKKYMLSAAYFPCDGINEKGVVIASNSVHSTPEVDPEKTTIGSFQATRLILDYAKNVDEAIELFKKYNIYFINPELESHYLISDASGKSVIVEFINQEMRVIEPNQPWQVNTNFALCHFEDEEDAFGACPRFKNAFNYLKKKNGILESNESFEILKKTSQSITLYSAVYNNTNGDIKLATRKNFDRIFNFKLDMAN